MIKYKYLISTLLIPIALSGLTQQSVAESKVSTKDTPNPRVLEIQRFFSQPDNKVKFQFASPETQYAWQHLSRFYLTAQIPRAAAIFVLEKAIDPSIGLVSFTNKDGEIRTVNEHFEKLPMDALIVVKDGKILFERYKTMDADTKHLWFSSSKVVPATLLALLENEGKADLSAPVSMYLKQLKGSVWDKVTVKETLDMATGLNGTEHDEPSKDSRTNPEQLWFRWASTLGIMPAGKDKSPWDVLRSMERRRPGHEVFEYNSIDTFVIARIVEAIEDRPISEIFSNRIWKKMGAEHDGYLGVAPNGMVLAFGFVNSTLRDFARFGMIYTPSGSMLSGEPIIPDAVIRRMQTGGRPEMFDKGYVGQKMKASFPDVKGLTNQYQWDAIFPNGDLYKAGVGGQGVYVSPSRNMVVAYFMTGTGNEQSETMARAIVNSVK